MSDYKIGSIVPLTEESKEARLVYALKNLNSTIADRDALRAELAAAKNLLARIHRDGGHHTEAVGFTQSVADADTKVSGWLLAADDRNALAADNARLRAALEKIRDRALPLGLDRGDSVTMLIAEEALAATANQSLAVHDAALLREVARLVDDCSAEKVRAEADRIEKEAPHA